VSSAALALAQSELSKCKVSFEAATTESATNVATITRLESENLKVKHDREATVTRATALEVKQAQLTRQHIDDQNKLTSCTMEKAMHATESGGCSGKLSQCSSSKARLESSTTLQIRQLTSDKEILTGEKVQLTNEKYALESQKAALASNNELLTADLGKSVPLDVDGNGRVETADSICLYIAVNLPEDFGGKALMAKLQNAMAASGEHLPKRGADDIFTLVAQRTNNVAAAL
jgi:hypothetical protein